MLVIHCPQGGGGKSGEVKWLPSAELGVLGGRQPTGGRDTMAWGLVGVGPRDARKKRADKPWHFASNARAFALMKYLPTS